VESATVEVVGQNDGRRSVAMRDVAPFIEPLEIVSLGSGTI
jgi:hypothetical protein